MPQASWVNVFLRLISGRRVGDKRLYAAKKVVVKEEGTFSMLRDYKR